MMSCLGAASQANGAMNNIAFFCFAHIRDRPTARNLMRLLHAFHHLAYMEFGAKIANPRSWEMLQDRHLLTAEECAYLKDAKRCGSKKTIHVLSWAVQIVSREQREGRIPPPAFNVIFADLMSLRGACGSLKSLTENPIPFGYMFAVNLLLYCWALSVGLFFAGFLSVYGSVAYALVVYIFFNLRLIGIQLSEPFGYEDRHLPVPEILMRNFVDHRELLADSTLPIGDGVDKPSPVDSAPAPDFCAPFEAAYDKAFMTHFKTSEANKQMAFAQGRFGFPGSACPEPACARACACVAHACPRSAAPQSPPRTATRASTTRRSWCSGRSRTR
jgi:predicted membrane chloride channel (bestrophin family)